VCLNLKLADGALFRGLGILGLKRTNLLGLDGKALRNDVGSWPVSTVRGNAATRPESVVKPTCQEHCSTDAIDPKLPFGVLGPNVLRRWLANTAVSPSEGAGAAYL
jgi:hypothetical protein